jgi:hypothetical protein
MPDDARGPIDLGEVARRAADDRFWAIRGHAVQAYASLEQSLCRLFGQLADTPLDAASIIFFRIASTQARNAISKSLFKRKHGTFYNLFRNSFFEQLRPIDQERNEIVHWNVVNHISTETDGTVTVQVVMHPAAFVYDGTGPNPPIITTSDLEAFIVKCDFYARLCNMFVMTTGDLRIPEAEKEPWFRIFSEPITYPPPSDHPLSPKPNA